MDRNRDGVITREEWTGTAQSFRETDWNRDGILSGDEIRVNPRQHPASSTTIGDFDRTRGWAEPTSGTRPAFRNSDYDRNGRIVAGRVALRFSDSLP